MPFEEDLRRRFEVLTDQIRDEVTRQLAIASGELTAAIEAERAAAAAQAAADARVSADEEAAARLTDAVAAAEARGRQAGLDEGRRDGLAQGRQKGRDEARADARAAERAADERLIDAVRAIDRARSLSEILDTLAQGASREAARVGVLLVRGTQLHGWRFAGFGPALEEAGRFELPLAEAGVIAEAVRTGVATSADGTRGTTRWAFADLPPGRDMLAVPVPMSGQVVAVLYADQGPDDPDRDPGHPAPAAAWPAVLEILARHATRCLEAVTAFRAAQVLTESGSDSGAPSLAESPVARDAHAGGSVSMANGRDTQGDEDEAARRYARLLVSEIKLYHESSVIEGRRDRDLASRLGGEIARARVLYDQRVSAHLRGATDYFHTELVRTLANGDASLLGQPR